MPNPQLLSLLGLNDVDMPVSVTQAVDGQTAKKLEPIEESKEKESLYEHPHDMKAYQTGWLVLIQGEVYNKRASFGSEVFIERQPNGTWRAWRETWSKDNKKSQSEKTIAAGVPFELALRKANEYMASWGKFRSK